jgi:SAM-dependent methyltransferase
LRVGRKGVVRGTRYDDEFFRWLDDAAVRSAEAVVPIVLELVPVESVADVGCGRGAWLSVFSRLGVGRFLGIDGPYVDLDSLAIPRESFLAHDLTMPLTVDGRFDLVVSLEVAEHLPAESARSFVELLTRLGPVVLFSAAVPGQGGTDHVNEQWPEYWAAMFAEHSYRVIDAVRPRVWNDPRVEPWYAQNLLLFVSEDAIPSYPELRPFVEAPPHPLSVIHPRLFEGPRKLPLRQLVPMLKASLWGPAKQSTLRGIRRVRAWIAGDKR